MTHRSITFDFIDSRLKYDNGVLYWRKKNLVHRYDNRWNLRFAGIPAGTTTKKGYIIINISNEHGKHMILAHKLVYLLHNGYIPDQIDHINGIKTDNRNANLRPVTNTGNRKNSKIRNDNSSGIMGISWNKVSKKWHVYANMNNRRFNIGFFGNFFEACCQRKSHELKFNYHKNHGRAH